MSNYDTRGPSEGTWSVFAEKMMAERDAARREADELRARVEALAKREDREARECREIGMDSCAAHAWEPDAMAHEARAAELRALLAPPERLLVKRQPCGCVICTCEDEEKCQGCGSRHCGAHPVGVFRDPVYVAPPPERAGER